MDKADIPTFVIVVEDSTACPFLIRDVVDKCNLADYRDCEGPDGSSCPLCSCIVAVKSKKFWEDRVVDAFEDEEDGEV
jgi:hypothetical protein